ncbi:DUF4174 domain-containing protein [Spongiivirga citrea]|uniref:DUF4174 domain-containing protein n=1 Tax=Spongiivirga citrea TaxID=1481457 RepID=A0A6M0CYF2_9FLAO|nr:DUF4174 domain-containing protein [Spongiivirga citrea]NER18740.1 DUF4174 domain-containing protein [Spongiivirga citrea]
MKYLLIFCFCLGLQAQDANPLLQYQKGKRLVILLTKSVTSTDYNAQLNSFNDFKKEMRERDVVLFTLEQGRLVNHKRGKEYQVDEASVRKAYKLSKAFNGIILIGKDTRIKMSEPFGVLPDRIFSSIDKMPMRKREMRKGE